MRCPFDIAPALPVKDPGFGSWRYLDGKKQFQIQSSNLHIWNICIYLWYRDLHVHVLHFCPYCNDPNPGFVIGNAGAVLKGHPAHAKPQNGHIKRTIYSKIRSVS